MKFYLSLLVLFIVSVGSGCERVEKPQLNGQGPLAILLDKTIAVPNYHNPIEWWKRKHMEMINIGDFSKRECMLCHDAETSCNNCHRYVGVRDVEIFD